MVRKIYVDKYASILQYLKERDGKVIDFPAVCKHFKVNNGLKPHLETFRFIEVDSHGTMKVLYDESYAFHARQFLDELASYQRSQRSRAAGAAANSVENSYTILVSRTRSLLMHLDYEALTDAQAKEVLLLESILKKFEK